MTEELDMIYDEFKSSNGKTLVHLENELTKIRAGKASPAMLNGVMIEYYGSMTPLQQETIRKLLTTKLTILLPNRI
ncbi:MAG: ribosome recycling factor [Crocinitomicaceae bacterium]|nr:ribosome recycling factor [Crocinitomicaceae bacterium]